MGRLRFAERPPASGSQPGRLLKSLAGGVVSAVSDANLIVVLIVFTAICLLALHVDALAPGARLAMRQLGPYP